MRIYILIIIFSIVFGHVNSSYISEISFINEEFVEVYFNETNMPKTISIVENENESKNNTAHLLINYTNSSFILIIGSNFQNKFNLEKFKCNIYLTDKSQVSNGGLKSQGENFKILYSNRSLTYNSNKNFNFKENQTLNYNFSDFFVGNSTPCKKNIILSKKETYNSSKNLCKENFSINPQKSIFENKLEFSFHTALENYTIEYWIEEYKGKIVKEKRNTSNLNKKVFTPEKKTQLYTIKGNLYYDNCILNDSIKVTYFHKEDLTKENKSKKSYIKIINEEELFNGNKEVKIEIYRGETNKRIINLYLNSNKKHVYEIEKFSKLKIKTFLNLIPGKNELYLEGLGEAKKLIIFLKKELVPKKTHKNKEEIKKIKKYFNISNVTLKNELVNTTLKTNIKNNTVICYILLDRTKVSKVKNISFENSTQILLFIEESKIKKKYNETKIKLKLLCKYKPKEIKTFYSKSIKFNFTLQEEIKTQNQTIENIISNSTQLNFQPNKIININSSKNKIIEETVFKSRTQELKEKSFLFIFIGTIIIFIIIIFKI